MCVPHIMHSSMVSIPRLTTSVGLRCAATHPSVVVGTAGEDALYSCGGLTLPRLSHFFPQHCEGVSLGSQKVNECACA